MQTRGLEPRTSNLYTTPRGECMFFLTYNMLPYISASNEGLREIDGFWGFG